MPLLAPSISPAVSTFSKQIRVRGQLNGARVFVFQGNQIVAQGTATPLASGDQLFPVKGTLQPSQRLYAVQVVGSQRSLEPPAAEQVTVARSPRSSSDLGVPTLKSHLYTCGQYLRIDQAFPGALITVGLSGRRVHPGTLGSSYAPDGVALFPLRPPLPAGTGITISQSVPNINGQDVSLPGADQPPFAPHSTTSLPPPSFSTPLYRGQTQIFVQNVIDGSTVSLLRYRDALPWTFELTFAQDSGWVLVDPVMPGDLYGVMQALPCGGAPGGGLASVWWSSPGNQNQVMDAPPPSPQVTSTVSTASTNLSLAGLLPGATVRVFVTTGFGANEVGDFQSWTRSCTISLPPNALADATAVYVGQTLLDPALEQYWSYSNVVVLTQPEIPNPLPSLGPAVVGAPLVHVTNVPSGDVVRLVSARFNTLIGTAQPDAVIDGEADIELSFPLVAGDTVSWIAINGALFSNAQTVGTAGPLMIPVIPSPASDCGGSVLVTGVQPGARVEVYGVAPGTSGYVFFGQAFATMGQVSVPVPPLVDGEHLRARQVMAGTVTDLSEEALGTPGSDFQLLSATSSSTSIGCTLVGAGSIGFGATGTDLGVSTDAVVNGQHVTFLFFGDVFNVRHGGGGVTKPVGFTTAAVPSQEPCIPLTLLVDGSGRIQGLKDDTGNIDFTQPSNVPTGAFTFNNTLYVFVQSGAPENGHGVSFLVSADPTTIMNESGANIDVASGDASGAWTYSDYNQGEQKFAVISPSVIENVDWLGTDPGLPASATKYQYGVLLFGCGPYRGDNAQGQAGMVPSVLSLAWMPMTNAGPLPSELMYWTGNGWSASQADTSPVGLLPPAPLTAQWDLGEISVFWDEIFRRWVAFFATARVGLPEEQGTPQAGGCAFYYSSAPWGTLQEGVYVWSTVDATTDASLILSVPRDTTDGAFDSVYGPYRVLRYGSWNPWQRTRTMFYTVSTNPGNPDKLPLAFPYAVYLCRTTFKPMS